jgi:hypothetical protein
MLGWQKHTNLLRPLPVDVCHSTASTHAHAGSISLSTARARLLLLVRWLAATNKPTNMHECTAALLSFLYRHSILAWCPYVLVPCPCNLRLLLSAFSWPGTSDPAPYSCHPYPRVPVTLFPVPSPYTPYSCHPVPYTRRLKRVILYRTTYRVVHVTS